MLKNRTGIAVVILSLVTWTSAQPLYYNASAADKLGPGAAQRIEQIAAQLQEQPRGFGVSIRQRPYWDAVGQSQRGRAIVQKAESLLKQPMPVLTDELYLMYSRNGSRTEAQNVMYARQHRLYTLCLAECIENNGRFMEALQQVLDSCISDRTWVMPAHDGNLDNFHRRTITIDLKSSGDAHTVALCLYLLGDKLSKPLSDKAQSRVHELVLSPYVRDVYEESGAARNWWRTTTNNWNSVCHAGVVGAALTLLPEKLDRAFFIERAMHYTDDYYKGFSADGYCSEGLGYWNYGYGHYIILSELIYSATGGKTDLFANPKGLPAALYPFRIEILHGQYPALADCDVSARPQAEWMGYVNARLGLSDARWPSGKELSGGSSLFEFLMFSQLDLNRPVITAPFASDHAELRTWFEDAGVLICRPAADSGRPFAVVLKGGHNDEHHNHNDLGTFILMIDDRQVILDPGGVEYTKTTFSKDRYTIKKLASYGHPVPLVAGTEQAQGASSRAKIIRRRFSEEADTLTMDLTSAYPVKELTKLQRTFTYSRKGAGSLQVTDDVEFSQPLSFETALITYGTCTRINSNTLEISDHGKTATVEITTDDINIEIDDAIVESTKGSPLRIAVRFEKPVKKGQISLRIWPK